MRANANITSCARGKRADESCGNQTGEVRLKSKKAIEAKIVKDVIPFEDKQLERMGGGLPVTRQDLDSVKERIGLLKEFVRTQLVKNTDYGQIVGTMAPSLYQPGAQKLARLFGISIEKECTERQIDREKNFAFFAYKATATHSRTGTVLATCEGSCNSQEKKYARRQNRQTRQYEDTPICDVLNTLMKMAQKRAMVGAVIEACGASDFFTQDIDSPEDADAIGFQQPTQKANVNVPKVNSASSEELRPQNNSQCPKCGNRMMVSKVDPSDWYCTPCRLKVPRS